MNIQYPFVSIIIAAYNAAEFIEKLLKSIPKTSSIEIIVVNDGSQDATADIVLNFAQRNSRIRLDNQDNAGVSAARNHGIREAKGKWLMFADADDWFDEEQFKMFIEHLENLDEATGIATFGVRHVYKQKAIEHRVQEQTSTILEFLQKGRFMEASWNYAFRKDLIDRYHIRFPEGIINTEDQNFNLKAMAASEKIASFDLVVYNYNKANESSASNKKHRKEWTEAPILSALDLLSFCQGNHLPLEPVRGNIAHLLYQFFEDHSSDISLWERRRVYRPAYKKICEAMPSFVHYRKYLIPYYSMTLGMLLFKIHDFIKK